MPETRGPTTPPPSGGTSSGGGWPEGAYIDASGRIFNTEGAFVGVLGQQIQAGRSVQAQYVGLYPVYDSQHHLITYLTPNDVWAGSIAGRMLATGVGTTGGTAGTTAGYGGSTYGEDLALLRERYGLEAAEAEKQRTWQERQNQLARENEQRLAIGNRISGLFEGYMNLVQEARDLRAQLVGSDPLRAAVAMRGGTQRGTTPYEKFMGQLGQAAQAPTPDISYALQPNADIGRMGVMERYLRGGIRGLSIGIPSWGLAGGGTVALQPGEGILVGEGEKGEGVKRGTAEVLTRNPDGSFEIIPLRGGAQMGANLTDERRDEIRAIQDVFAPIYGRLGFSGVPTGRRTVFGSYQPGGLGAAEGIRQLGYRPQFFQLSGTPSMYYLDPEGQLYSMSQQMFREAGLNPGQVLDVNLRDLGALSGRNVWEAPPALSALPSGVTEPLGIQRMTAPLVLPDSGGMILPAPELLAPFWGEFDTGTQQLILQAYGLTQQMSPEGALARMQFYTPLGSGLAGRTVGWG